MYSWHIKWLNIRSVVYSLHREKVGAFYSPGVGWRGLSAARPYNGAFILAGILGALNIKISTDSSETGNLDVHILSLHKWQMYIISELKICNLEMNFRPGIRWGCPSYYFLVLDMHDQFTRPCNS